MTYFQLRISILISALMGVAPCTYAQVYQDGYGNTAAGNLSLINFVLGNQGAVGTANTAFGNIAMASMTGGNFNTSMGDGALAFTTVGNSNTAIGFKTLY